MNFSADHHKLVIVDFGSIDSGTEHISATQTPMGTWIKTLPFSFAELTDLIVQKTGAHIKNHVCAAFICSLGKDTHARNLAASDAKCSPRTSLHALGVNVIRSLAENFPNINNMVGIEYACASGLAALDTAKTYKDINNGIVYVLGVEVPTSLQFLNYFRHLKAVVEKTSSPHAPFDQRRSGFVMADGAAFVAVTTQNYAIKNNIPIIAVIDSVDTRTIFTHVTSPTDGLQLRTFIETVIDASEKDVHHIAWWDAHATATPVGDQVEYTVFSDIFRDTNTMISSYKGAAGHTMAASSLVEIVNAISCIQHNYASETHGLTSEFKMVDDHRMITDRHSLTGKTFIKTSFGFGGRNGAAVISVL